MTAGAAHRTSSGGSPSPLRVLITGGGTGGHVYPGLAVAESLKRLVPAADVRFAGTAAGIEAKLVPAAGYRFWRVPASGFRGLGAVARLKFLLNFVRGWLRALLVMIGWRPHVVLGTGGYVSAPVMAAARTLGVPCALQEQNAIPGSTNRLVGRWARRIYLGFSGAARYFATDRCVDTGNPVRGAFAVAPVAARVDTSGRSARVLVFGGSRGAATLNTAVVAASAVWATRNDLELHIQTGAGRTAPVEDAYADAHGRVKVSEFIDDMPSALAWSDLVVCRSGAMTLAELHCAGKPAILVPFPYATDDHQLKNAADCEAVGAARVLTDDRCDGETLITTVEELLADPATLEGMARAAAGLARPHAADHIAADLLDWLGHAPAGDTDAMKKEHDVP